MKKEERQNRVIARGEFSNHAHVITGANIKISKRGNETIIEVCEDSNAALKHLLEKDWLEGREVWTKEHKDIPLEKGTYRYVQQQEFDPYSSLIRDVRD